MICRNYFKGTDVLPLNYCWPAGHGLPGWLIQHKIPYLTNDALADNQIARELCEQFGVRTAVSTPILDASGEAVVSGTLTLLRKPVPGKQLAERVAVLLEGTAAAEMQK